MPVRVDVISVGTLSRNRFWNETAAVRSAHATTTLLRDESTTIIVDPSLPADILRHRLDERTGLKPEQVDAVFLTCFRPVHRRGLALFDHATWLMDAGEVDAVQAWFNDLIIAAEARSEPVDEIIEQELALVERIGPAPDQITESIHLFPTPGVTPGSASLLVLQDQRTIAVAGDAVISREYFFRRQAFEQHSDATRAVQSLAEVIEIADIIIPGHDDWIINL